MNKDLISAIFAGLLVLCGCSSDQVETPKSKPQPINQFSLSKTSISAGYEVGSGYIDVVTDLPWVATTSANWIKLKPSSGTGNANVWISWLENNGFTDRNAAITFEAEVSGSSRKWELTVNQGHKVEASHIVSTRAVLGNLAKDEQDSVEVVFDKPTELLYYNLVSELYQLTTKAEKIGDGICWRLPLGIAGTGGEYGIQMAWKSAVDGIESRDTIYVPFYQKCFKLPHADSGIKYSALSLDKKSVWLAVYDADGGTDDNLLMQISLDDLKLLKTVKMPFAPSHICVNPYNGLLYVSGRKDYISVVDPAIGSVVKNIQIEVSPDAHPQYPTIYADEVAFTSDGFGIVRLVAANGATLMEWRYIDSANNDKITLSGYSWSEHQLENLYTNYDYSRIYANLYPSTYTTIEWFNRQNPKPNEIKVDGKFQSDKYYAGGSLMALSMSPFANKAFICTAPGSECVVSLEPVGYSEVLELEARGSKCVWDELVKDRDYVYQICWGNRLLVLYDMTRGEAIYGTRQEFDVTNGVVACHFLPATNQLLVTAFSGIYILDAAELKAKGL